MIRTTTFLLAGSLLIAAGCQPAVYGDRSYHSYPSSAPEGNDFPRTQVSGKTTFHDRVSGPNTATASADAPPDRVITSTRTETVTTTTPPQDTPRDEVARSKSTTDVDRPAPTPAPVAVTPPRPEPADRPITPPPAREATPTPTPPPADRPAAAADNDTKPTPPRDANANRPDPERVARANTARYPDDLKASDDLRAAASINRADRTVRIQNYTANEIRGGDLWVNETYVSPIPSIPAGGSTSVPLNGFFDRDAKPLPALTDTSKLQLQTAGKLYNLPLQPEDLNK